MAARLYRNSIYLWVLVQPVSNLNSYQKAKSNWIANRWLPVEREEVYSTTNKKKQTS